MDIRSSHLHRRLQDLTCRTGHTGGRVSGRLQFRQRASHRGQEPDSSCCFSGCFGRTRKCIPAISWCVCGQGQQMDTLLYGRDRSVSSVDSLPVVTSRSFYEVGSDVRDESSTHLRISLMLGAFAFLWGSGIRNAVPSLAKQNLATPRWSDSVLYREDNRRHEMRGPHER